MIEDEVGNFHNDGLRYFSSETDFRVSWSDFGWGDIDFKVIGVGTPERVIKLELQSFLSEETHSGISFVGPVEVNPRLWDGDQGVLDVQIPLIVESLEKGTGKFEVADDDIV